MKTKTRKTPKPTGRTGEKPLARWLDEIAAARVSVPDPKKVLGYCREHPGLSRELPRVAARTREFMGEEPELVLELYQDPEIDDRYLTIHVRSRVHEGLSERLERLSSEMLHDTWDDRLGYILLMPAFLKARPTNGV